MIVLGFFQTAGVRDKSLSFMHCRLWRRKGLWKRVVEEGVVRELKLHGERVMEYSMMERSEGSKYQTSDLFRRNWAHTNI